MIIEALRILAYGMAGIFVVIGIIILTIQALDYMGKISKKET